MGDLSNDIRDKFINKGADIVRFVDVSKITKEKTLGFDTAILFCMALSKQFILGTYKNLPMESEEFLEKEKQVEDLADWLSEYLKQKGYDAHSQSEKHNTECGYIEQAYISPDIQQGISILPQKAIARIAGLGFIGKNNLLVTEDYGCGLSMCSVLTNAPVATENKPEVKSKCGDCNICVKSCVGKALKGNEWSLEGGREAIIDVSKCCCPLKCMMVCPWTLKYAGG